MVLAKQYFKLFGFNPCVQKPFEIYANCEDRNRPRSRGSKPISCSFLLDEQSETYETSPISKES